MNTGDTAVGKFLLNNFEPQRHKDAKKTAKDFFSFLSGLSAFAVLPLK